LTNVPRSVGIGAGAEGEIADGVPLQPQTMSAIRTRIISLNLFNTVMCGLSEKINIAGGLTPTLD
jgi:hypothetical protein